MSLRLWDKGQGKSSARVDGAETKLDARESLHYEVLDLINGNAGVRGDDAEGDNTVGRGATEDGLDESHQADLLAKEGEVLLEDGLDEEGGVSDGQRR